MSAMILLLALCVVTIAYLLTRRGTTPSYHLPSGSVSAPAKGTPGYRTYMRDMRKA